MCTRAVGGLAHYFEGLGLPTTQISLIRQHTEQIKPPRALWVPFELGRPLGVPNDADYQKRVLLSALKLLEENQGSVLRDFEEDAPDTAMVDVVWACPVNLARKEANLDTTAAMRAAIKKEMVELRPWYDLAFKKQGRTTVGVSGLDMAQIVEFIGAFLDDTPENPRQDIALAYSLNFAVDDLKSYYYEAAAAQPGAQSPTSRDLDGWFWEQTAAAKVLFAIQDRCLASEDKMLQLVGKLLLIPSAYNQD